MNKQKVIMLFGQPRSGTTWVGKLFDSRPDTYYLHEPDSVQLDNESLIFPASGHQFTKAMQNKVDRWLACKDEKVIASLPFFKKSYMNPIQWLIFKGSAYLTKILGRLNTSFITPPIRWQSEPPIVVWKSIESLGRLAYFNQQPEHFGVHIIRHPCGHIASTLRGLQANNFIEEGSILEDWELYRLILEQAGEQRFTLQDVKDMEPEERLALRWGVANDFALKNAHQSRSQVLVYEDLCRSPLSTLTKVFENIGLTMPVTTERFIAESTSSNKDDYYATQKDPLVAANSWKKKLSAQQVANIKAMVMNFECSKFYHDDFEIDSGIVNQ